MILQCGLVPEMNTLMLIRLGLFSFCEKSQIAILSKFGQTRPIPIEMAQMIAE